MLIALMLGYSAHRAIIPLRGRIVAHVSIAGLLLMFGWQVWPKKAEKAGVSVSAQAQTGPQSNPGNSPIAIGPQESPKQSTPGGKEKSPKPKKPAAVPAPTSPPPTSAPVTPPTTAGDHSFVNNGVNYGTQANIDARSYGARQPPPPVSERTVSPLAPVRPPDPAGMSPDEYKRKVIESGFGMGSGFIVAEPSGKIANPGLSITVRMSGAFGNPAFKVTCDAPCSPSADFVYSGSGMNKYKSGSYAVDANDPRIVFFFLAVRMLYPSQIVYLAVRSVDSTVLKTATVDPYIQ
jgi:hypothetical protein